MQLTPPLPTLRGTPASRRGFTMSDVLSVSERIAYSSAVRSLARQEFSYSIQAFVHHAYRCTARAPGTNRSRNISVFGTCPTWQRPLLEVRAAA